MRETNHSNDPLALVILAIIVWIILRAERPAAQEPESPATSTVSVRVIDGDTVEVFDMKKSFKLRFIGIDTPELNSVNPALKTIAVGAKKRLQSLIDSGGAVTYSVSKQDKFQRWLGVLFVNGVSVSDVLLQEGWAVEWDGTGVSPWAK